MKYFIHYIFLMLSGFGFSQTTLTISTPQTGDVENKASQEVILLPDYDYVPNSPDAMWSYIDPTSASPTTYGPLFNPSSFNRPLDPSLTVGTTQSEYAVTETGAVSYNVPITLPSGTAGMTPILSINYHSQSPSGLLGVGWSLNSGSMITRTKNTIYHNDEVAPISADNNDVFVFDGNRMLVVGGSNGANGATYRTELETYIQLKSHGNLGGGPEWFEAITKEGQIIEFGRTPDSRFVKNGVALYWKVNKITDQNGNYILYDYTLADNELRLRKISYTGNANTGLTPYATARFYYSERTDKNTSFIHGNAMESNVLLERINIKVGNNLFKEYKFKYGFEKHSFLTEIEEYGAAGGRFNSTIFKYGTPASPFSTSSTAIVTGQASDIFPGDFNGDGIADLFSATYAYDGNGIKYYTGYNLYHNNGTGQTYTFIESGSLPNGTILFQDELYKYNNIANLSISDFNGDGLDDILISEYAAGSSGPPILDEIGILFSHGNGMCRGDFSIPSIYTRVANLGYFAFPGDFDGDGITDLITVLTNQTGSTHQSRLTFGQTAWGGTNCQNMGPLGSSVHNNIQGFNLDNLAYSSRTEVIDFDGDGKHELMVVKDNNTTIYTFENPSPGIVNAIVLYSAGYPTSSHNFLLGDFNGDAKTDFLRTIPFQTTYEVSYSNGTSYEVEPFAFQKQLTNSDRITLGDYNGDGSTDIIQGFNFSTVGSSTIFDASKINVHYHTGKGVSSVESNEHGTIINSFIPLISADMNGDGKTDVISKLSTSQNLTLFHFYKSSTELLLEKVKDGFNNEVSFAYRSLADKNFYNRGTNSTYPLFDFEEPVYVAQFVRTPNADGTNSFHTYLYEEAILHRQGKGLLGFKNIKRIDNTTLLTEERQFNFHPTYFHPTLKKEITRLTSTSAQVMEVEYGHTFVGLGGKRFTTYPSIVETTDFLKGHLTTVTSTYNTAHGNLISSLTDYNGAKTVQETVTYGTFGTGVVFENKVLSATKTVTRTGESPYARITEFTYDPKGNMLTETLDPGEPKSLTTTSTYNDFGMVTSTVRSTAGLASRSEFYEYDSRGRFPIKSTNTLGQESFAEYDPTFGLAIKTTDVDGLIAYATIDEFGQVESTTKPNGQVQSTTLSWVNINPGNPSGNPVLTEDVMYKLTTTVDGRPTKEEFKNSLGITRKVETEGFNQTVKVIHGYNSRGLRTTSTSPFSTGTPIVTTNTFDDHGRIVSSSNGVGTATYSYVAVGNLFKTTISNPDGTQQTTYTDGAGIEVKSEDNGGTIEYEYTSSEGQREVKINGTVVSTALFDQYGNQTLLTEVNSGNTQYETNAYGELITQTDANGNAFQYVYDMMGRMAQETGPDGITTYSYVNSGNGLNLIEQISAPNGTSTNFVYDGLNRLIEQSETVNSQSFTYKYGYDQYDNNTSIEYPSGFKVVNVYNAQGYLEQVTNDAGTVVFWQANDQDALGNYTSYTKGNGITTTESFNGFGLLEHIQAPGVQDLSMSYNLLNANLLSRNDAIKGLSETFSYDNLNRLIESNVPSQTAQFVNYDQNGNIATKTDAGIYQYDTQKINAVVKVSNNFNEISLNQQDISYNSFHGVAQITEDDRQLFYTYGPDRQRRMTELHDLVSSVVLSTNYYVGMYEKIIQGSNETEIHYIGAGDGVTALYVLENGVGSMKYVYKDHVGSYLTITDDAGTVIDEQNFDAWGRRRNITDWSYNVTSSPPVYLTRGYTGHLHLDDFTLIDMNGRIYDPIVARMLNPDNFVQNPFYTQSYNRYTYAFNNPLSYTDPNGEVAWFVPVAAWLLLSDAGYELQKIISPIAIHIDIRLGLGSGQTGFGYDISYGVPKLFPFSVRWHFGHTYFFRTYGGRSGWETRVGGEWAFSLYAFKIPVSFTYSGTTFSGVGYPREQTTNTITVGNPFFNVSYENDTEFGNINFLPEVVPEYDGGDAYRTAAIRVKVGPYSLGTIMHTGEPEINPNTGWYQTGTDQFGANAVIGGSVGDPNESYGILFVGFGPARIGIDAEGIRHLFQNRMAHDHFFKVGHGQFYPHYTRLDRRPRFYFQFGWSSGSTFY